MERGDSTERFDRRGWQGALINGLEYTCCQSSVHVDRHGVTNHFTYDGNKRLESAVLPLSPGVYSAYTFGYLGEGELSSISVGPSPTPAFTAIPPPGAATRSFLHTVTNGMTLPAARVTPSGKTRDRWTGYWGRILTWDILAMFGV